MEENVKKRRIFIALNLPKEIKEELGGMLLKLNREVCGVKWVKPNGLHLTLHFLSYLEEEKIEEIKNIMVELSGKFGPMNFEAGELGAFPSLTSPRVIFLDCRQTNGDLVYKLQKELGKELEKIGIEIDSRPWQAHLTLGRVKTKLPQSIHSLAKYAKIKNKNFSVDSFELMESRLKPDGAEYSVVKSCKL